METFKSITGLKIEVHHKGKSFVSIITFPATKRFPEETKTTNHKCYSGVEKLLKKWRVDRV